MQELRLFPTIYKAMCMRIEVATGSWMECKAYTLYGKSLLSILNQAKPTESVSQNVTMLEHRPARSRIADVLAVLKVRFQISDF